MRPADSSPDPERRESDARSAGKKTPPKGLKRTVLRGGGMTGGGYILAQTLNLGAYVVLSRLLTPGEFGSYAAATVLIGFGVLITESGMQAALIQRKDRIEEAQNTAVVACFAGGLLAGLAALATAPLLGLFFDSGEIAALAAASSGVILVMVMAVVPNAILQREFSFLRLLVVDPIEVIAFAATSIVLAANGLGPWALVIGQYTQVATGTVLSWALVRWRPDLRLASVAMWRELVAYGRHIFTSTSIARLGEYAADSLIIGRGLGTAALGQYRYAFRVASLPFYALLAGAAYVIFPAFARIADDVERLRRAFIVSLRWMAAVAFPAGLALIPLGPPLIVTVFGDVWGPAGDAVMAMSLYAGASAISSAVSELTKAKGQPRSLVGMHSVTAAVTVIGMLALLPFGLTAAAGGLSIGAVVGAAYALRVANRVAEVRVSEMLHEIWPPLLAGLFMAGCLLPLDRLALHAADHGEAAALALIAVEALAGALIYLLALRVLAPGTPREILEPLLHRSKPEEAPDPDLLPPDPGGFEGTRP